MDPGFIRSASGPLTTIHDKSEPQILSLSYSTTVLLLELWKWFLRSDLSWTVKLSCTELWSNMNVKLLLLLYVGKYAEKHTQYSSLGTFWILWKHQLSVSKICLPEINDFVKKTNLRNLVSRFHPELTSATAKNIGQVSRRRRPTRRGKMYQGGSHR